jgi:hypothetical protein
METAGPIAAPRAPFRAFIDRIVAAIGVTPAGQPAPLPAHLSEHLQRDLGMADGRMTDDQHRRAVGPSRLPDFTGRF